MNKISRKPKEQQSVEQKAKYQPFSLTENPFPTSPVNKDSSDPRINGQIYEADIRTKEYEKIKKAFLASPQTDPSHLRLGYIWDTSYIGRGNGKSAFLVNLIAQINKEYCLDISEDANKCFAVYVVPETGGRTKTFDSLVDLIFEAIYSSGFIASALACLRLNAIEDAYPEICINECDDTKLIQYLNTEDWLRDLGVDPNVLMGKICDNEFLQKIPQEFPLFSSRSGFLIQQFITEEVFRDSYKSLKKGRDKLDFVFSYLVQMFLAAGFNGGYIFIDDFERVPDFQSGRQRRDFAAELRSILLDGSYENARFGFFNMFLVLHAGVPALISEAWTSSGLNHRYPLSPKVTAPHLIPFEKISRDHVTLLIQKYLDEYRCDSISKGELTPFTSSAINLIAEESEYNAATILRTCSGLIEKSLEENRTQIDETFVRSEFEKREGDCTNETPPLDDPDAEDLIQKAREGQ